MIDLVLITGIIVPDALADHEYSSPWVYSVPIASLYDRFSSEYNVKILIPDILKRDYDIPEARVYAMSMYYSEIIEARKIINKIKEKYPNSAVVVGGYYATFFPDDLKKYIPNVDHAICGDGISEISDILKEHEIQNLHTVENRERNVTASSVLDKNAYLFLDWEKIENNLYCDLDSKWVTTAEGCLYSCSFCTNKMIKGTTYREIDPIINDINKYLQHNPESRINFTEPLFSARTKFHRQYIKNLLDRVYNETNIAKKNEIGIFCRISDFDDEFISILSKYKDKFVFAIYAGIDNLNDEILTDMKKCETKESVFAYMEKISKLDFISSLCTNIIIGTPKDSEEKFFENLENTKKIYSLYRDSSVRLKITSTVLWLLPGSQYYAEKEKYPEIFIQSNNIDDLIQMVPVDDRLQMNIGMNTDRFKKYYEYRNIFNDEIRPIRRELDVLRAARAKKD